MLISRPGDPERARFGPDPERTMAKIGISSTDLVWVFHERLEAFDDASRGVPIAIVPAPGVGWRAILGKTQNPPWARRVEGIQKQPREIYVLRD
jgi:hypothetical protein